MKQRRSVILFLLKRHWLALAVGCLTCLFLYLRLEPRPTRQVKIELSDSQLTAKWQARHIGDLALSKDGSYASIMVGRRDIFLLRFATNTLVDTQLTGVEQMDFDTGGELVLVSRHRDPKVPNQFTSKLIRYQPATQT